jgi:hypothetical protein
MTRYEKARWELMHEEDIRRLQELRTMYEGPGYLAKTAAEDFGQSAPPGMDLYQSAKVNQLSAEAG